jgi:signal-transduction protein with cAMP-binding, CBS, and nucleotidyltransferase domain
MDKAKAEVKDKVKHFINPPPIHINANLPVIEACKRMKKYNVGSILVADGKHFIGIFTETDLLKKVVAQNVLPAIILVSQVMEKNMIYIDSESSMVEAFLKMQTHNIRHLVVKENNEISGILSIKDVASFYVHKFSKA